MVGPLTVSREVLQEAINKLLTGIGAEVENKAFELTYLTNRIVQISGVEEIAIGNRTMKNLLITGIPLVKKSYFLKHPIGQSRQ